MAHKTSKPLTYPLLTRVKFVLPRLSDVVSGDKLILLPSSSIMGTGASAMAPVYAPPLGDKYDPDLLNSLVQAGISRMNRLTEELAFTNSSIRLLSNQLGVQLCAQVGAAGVGGKWRPSAIKRPS